eukprot:2936465-Pleurochrysis_carterae.AAC.1
MDAHDDRVLAYMAQNAQDGIEFKTNGDRQLIAYPDSDLSDWAVSHSTTGSCITYGGAAIAY